MHFPVNRKSFNVFYELKNGLNFIVPIFYL